MATVEPTATDRADPPRLAALGRAFDAAVRSGLPAVGRCTVLFSGGVDSALVAEAAVRFGDPTLLTVGLPGASDAAFVESLQLPWPVGSRVARLSAKELERARSLVDSRCPSLRSVERAVLSSLAAALGRAADRVVLCGQGADELFLGYAHFRGLAAAEAVERSDRDLQKLLDRDWPASIDIARAIGRDLRAPFLDPGVMRRAREIPVAERLPGALTKPPLRALARARGIPQPIADRPKRAIQYGTGVDRWLRRPAAPGG